MNNIAITKLIDFLKPAKSKQTPQQAQPVLSKLQTQQSHPALSVQRIVPGRKPLFRN